MNALKTIAPIVGALALSAAPALAGSDGGNGTPPANQGTAHKQAAQTHTTNTPGPKASLPAKAKAYGRYCQGTSKLRADATAGSHGTPFSQCVTAMAKVAHSQASAKTACRTLSHKKAKGAKRSDFSTCVNGAAKLKHDLKAAS